MTLKNKSLCSLIVIAGIHAACAWAANTNVSIPTASTTYPANVIQQPAVASQCMGCHGPNGISQYPEWPNISGQKSAYIEAQLRAFRAGERVHPMMQPIATSLSDSDIQTLASHFGAQQEPAQGGVTASTPKGNAPTQATSCPACHNASSEGAAVAWPKIDGQKPAYLRNQLRAFRSGARKSPFMSQVASKLSDEDIETLVVYFGTR